MSTSTVTETRADERVMLALIALAELPTPSAIRFISGDDGPAILSLQMKDLAAGLAWSAVLGGTSDTYVNDGRRYLNEGIIRWRGWRVNLHASEPERGTGTPLDSDTTAALTAGTVTATAAAGDGGSR
jgi:hypothetical protein